MGYTKKNVTSQPVGLSSNKKGIINVDSLQTAMKLMADRNRFNELEPVEVLNVCLTEKDLPPDTKGNPDYSYYGSILGRYVYSEQNLEIDKCKFFRPLNNNMTRVPIIGEIFFGFEDEGDRFYFGNIFNNFSVTNNAQPNISTLDKIGTNISNDDKKYTNSPNVGKYKPGYYYEALSPVRPLKLFEGDTIIQGRFGNSIRLGSNQSQDFFNDTTNGSVHNKLVKSNNFSA